MNEQDQRALWFIFHCRRCRKELWILSFRDTRFCLFASLFLYLFFCHLFRLTQQTGPKRRDSSYSGGLLMSKIWWVFFRLRIWCFFPFLDFPCSFPRMTRYSKRNRGKQLTTRNYSNIFSQRVSHRFFPQSINFGRFFFPSMLVVIISWSLCRHRQHILIEYLMNSVSF